MQTFLSLASWSMGRRLYTMAVVLSVALAGVAAYAGIQLHNVAALADRARALRVPQLQRVADMELNVTRVSLQLRHAMLARTPEEQAAALADVLAKRKLIDQALADYGQSLSGASQQAHASIARLLGRFWDVGGGNLQLITQGQKAEAFAYLVERTIPARNELLAALKEGVAQQQAQLSQEIKELESRAEQTLAVLLALVLAAVVGQLLFARHLVRLLRQRVALSRCVAERVRDGDLTLAVQDPQRDEFTPLLSTLADMQASLTQVVSHVRANAEGVSQASTQIAQGNLDLSQRTEQQASALQQTSATMDELGSTVSNNADNARHARGLAEGASAIAAKGGAVVGQVIETMRDINTASRQISDIIGVIDGIAFQTNILALNAAVEAARAGEQGRGFAVVASEVRSLAQRSAEAARQIKQLITSSVARVDQGSVLVGQAGETMDEIVAAIQRVTQIVGEISSASAEQSSGVSQVGQAVTQMDQATQRNAALVEESAAAAESLREQAAELLRSVGVFKLRDSAR